MTKEDLSNEPKIEATTQEELKKVLLTYVRKFDALKKFSPFARAVFARYPEAMLKAMLPKSPLCFHFSLSTCSNTRFF